MFHGVHKRKRPSGNQQRKTAEAKKAAISALGGSLLKYVKRNDDSHQSQYIRDESACQGEDPSDSEASDNTTHSTNEQKMKVAATDLSDGEIKIDNSKSKESEESLQEYVRDELQETDLHILDDCSLWKIPVSHHMRIEIIRLGSQYFQNKEGPFTVVTRNDNNTKGKGNVRHLNKEWFYRMLPNGEKILRSWMVYSCAKGNLYCFCCRLFATNVSVITSKFVTGFNTWWKLHPKVQNHESSEEHLCCLEKWKTLATGLKLHKTIDSELVAMRDLGKKKWRDILHRLLDITLFLAKQNLAFRGHNEDKKSLNKGNYLELVELVSKYDPVLKEHLTRLEQNIPHQKSISYLSPTIQNEFISILANHVKEILVSEVRSAKYFGIMFDSTPDLSHVDQMSEVIRYVKIDNGKVEVKEVFLGYFPLDGKKAIDLTSQILEYLNKDGLDIMMCRAQGYDNAATMAGVYGGVQAILKEKNKKAIFNVCVDHSLNLCGQHSFAVNASAVKFFGTLESIYSFFAASTHRWEILIKHSGVSTKRLSTTRWSAHYAAVKPVKEKFDDFVTAIKDLCKSHENLDTRSAAENLLPAVCEFTFLCYLYFWSDILKEVNLAQQYLQTKGLTLDKVVTKLEALKLFLGDNRNSLVNGSIQQALVKAEEYGISVERRTRYKKRMTGEKIRDTGLSLHDENKRAMLECIDRFYSELCTRSNGVKEVSAIFEVIQGHSLLFATNEELEISTTKLTNIYDEVNKDDLLTEIPRLRRHLKAAKIDVEVSKKWSVLDYLSFIVKWDFLDSLPTLAIALKLFLTICVSVASCERSFSKLKLIKNYLRTTMSQTRLSALAILSIENETASNIDFDDVIYKFAALKSRKLN